MSDLVVAMINASSRRTFLALSSPVPPPEAGEPRRPVGGPVATRDSSGDGSPGRVARSIDQSRLARRPDSFLSRAVGASLVWRVIATGRWLSAFITLAGASGPAIVSCYGGLRVIDGRLYCEQF